MWAQNLTAALNSSTLCWSWGLPVFTSSASSATKGSKCLVSAPFALRWGRPGEAYRDL